MTIGPPQKVLKELAALIAATDSGAATVEWGTAHGKRVVEMDTSTSAPGEAVVTGDEPVDYVKVGGLLSVQPAENQQPEKPGRNPVLGAFVDTWRTLFPPREQRRQS